MSLEQIKAKFNHCNLFLPTNLCATIVSGKCHDRDIFIFFSLVKWSTGEKVKIDNNKLTAIQKHLLCCNYFPSFEDFSILTKESNDFKMKIIESLLTARNKPVLNKADS